MRADTGEPLAVVVDPAFPGVVIDGDADSFGQRLAAGGSVELDAVPIAADDVPQPDARRIPLRHSFTVSKDADTYGLCRIRRTSPAYKLASRERGALNEPEARPVPR